MELVTNAPRGTADILPQESVIWQYVEDTIKEVCATFNLNEIRFPTFEHTELFERGVGDTTDVVQKEMYTFLDKGGRSITMRPEGTAGAVRLMLQNGLYGTVLPLKLYYLISCFRYEKPQAGRLREFHQFGAEFFGSEKPFADAEVISLANAIFKKFSLKDINLYINSIGCNECRKNYHNALKEYFEKNIQNLCQTCIARLVKNPMRILDCKNESCSKISAAAPLILDYICTDCSEHFESVKQALSILEIDYKINPKIVRGLDYYNRTVFEFVSEQIGAQGTVCGGGRYDGLCYELGKENIAGLGFGMGLERLIMLLKTQNLLPDLKKESKIYFANIGQEGKNKAIKLAMELRDLGINAEFDISERSLKAQMKYADKIGANFVIVLGEDEIKQGKAELKNMKNGEKTEISLNISEILKHL